MKRGFEKTKSGYFKGQGRLLKNRPWGVEGQTLVIRGVALGEWKGTGAKTKGALVLGLVVLAASIAIAVVAKSI